MRFLATKTILILGLCGIATSAVAQDFEYKYMNIYTGQRDITLSDSFLDARYLKLDASNDPITSDLEIDGSLQVDGGTLTIGTTPVSGGLWDGYSTLEITNNQGNVPTGLVIRGGQTDGNASAGSISVLDEDEDSAIQLECWSDRPAFYSYGVGKNPIFDVQPGGNSIGDWDPGFETHFGAYSTEGQAAITKFSGHPTGGTRKYGYVAIEDTTSDFHIGAENDIILVPTGGDVKLELGDAAGTNTVSIIDSTGTNEVAQINSDGQGTFAEGVIIGDHANDALMKGITAASGFSRFTIQPAAIDSQLFCFFLPSGNRTLSEFQMSNTSDADHRGRLRIGITGATALIQTDKKGTATTPTLLNIGEAASGSALTKISYTFVGVEKARIEADGDMQLDGDLIVDGGDIGLTADTNLMQIAANAATVNGDLTVTGTITTGDGGTTNYIQVDNVGDQIFVGDAGFPLGCMEGVDETVTCVSAGTWYQVTFDTAGVSNLTTINLTNEDMAVTYAGIYSVSAIACFHHNGGEDFELMVKTTDGTVDKAPHLFQTTPAGIPNQVENAAGTCGITLSAGERVELWVRCTSADNKDAIFDHVSLYVEMAGGG